MGKQIPIVDYLALDDGAPHLVAWEAVDSGASVLRPPQRRRQGRRHRVQAAQASRPRARSGRSRSCTAPCPASPRRTCRRSSTSTAAER